MNEKVQAFKHAQYWNWNEKDIALLTRFRALNEEPSL